MDKQSRKPGRPAIPEDEKLKVYTLRFTPSLIAKLKNIKDARTKIRKMIEENLVKIS